MEEIWKIIPNTYLNKDEIEEMILFLYKVLRNKTSSGK